MTQMSTATTEHRNAHLATLTPADFLTEDEFEFARETLGPDASEADVEALASERAHTAFEEYLDDLDDLTNGAWA